MSSVTNPVKHCISSQGIRALIFHVIVEDCNCRARQLKSFLVSPRNFTLNKSGYTADEGPTSRLL